VPDRWPRPRDLGVEVDVELLPAHLAPGAREHVPLPRADHRARDGPVDVHADRRLLGSELEAPAVVARGHRAVERLEQSRAQRAAGLAGAHPADVHPVDPHTLGDLAVLPVVVGVDGRGAGEQRDDQQTGEEEGAGTEVHRGGV
jgi:hypothetical protein